MNQRQKIIFRLIRNIVIALASAVWIIPFHLTIMTILTFWEIQEKILFEKEYGHGHASFSYIQIGKAACGIMAILLMITVIAWAFIAANKLWPINDNPKDHPKQ